MFWDGFSPFLMKQMYRSDLVVIASFVGTGYTTRRWGLHLGRTGYSITHHYPLWKAYVTYLIILCTERLIYFKQYTSINKNKIPIGLSLSLLSR
jgi:hypothetical protein